MSEAFTYYNNALRVTIQLINRKMSAFHHLAYRIFAFMLHAAVTQHPPLSYRLHS